MFEFITICHIDPPDKVGAEEATIYCKKPPSSTHDIREWTAKHFAQININPEHKALHIYLDENLGGNPTLALYFACWFARELGRSVIVYTVPPGTGDDVIANALPDSPDILFFTHDQDFLKHNLFGHVHIKTHQLHRGRNSQDEYDQEHYLARFFNFYGGAIIDFQQKKDAAFCLSLDEYDADNPISYFNKDKLKGNYFYPVFNQSNNCDDRITLQLVLANGGDSFSRECILAIYLGILGLLRIHDPDEKFQNKVIVEHKHAFSPTDAVAAAKQNSNTILLIIGEQPHKVAELLLKRDSSQFPLFIFLEHTLLLTCFDDAATGKETVSKLRPSFWLYLTKVIDSQPRLRPAEYDRQTDVRIKSMPATDRIVGSMFFWEDNKVERKLVTLWSLLSGLSQSMQNRLGIPASNENKRYSGKPTPGNPPAMIP